MSYYPARCIGSAGGAELWIGSARDAADPNFCARFGLVVNCTRHLPCGRSAPCIRVPIDDDRRENGRLLGSLPATCKAVENTLASGASVLVHCHAGISRSASVAAAALMFAGVGSLEEVVRRIRTVKPETFSVSGPDGNPQFMPALKEWERMLTRSRE